MPRLRDWLILATVLLPGLIVVIFMQGRVADTLTIFTGVAVTFVLAAAAEALGLWGSRDRGP